MCGQVAEPLVGYFAYGLLREVPGVEQVGRKWGGGEGGRGGGIGRGVGGEPCVYRAQHTIGGGAGTCEQGPEWVRGFPRVTGPPLPPAACPAPQTVVLPPRVVFGPRSSDDSAAPQAEPLSACGPAPGLPPLHAVVEGADPRSGLRAARTCFLCRGAAERDVFAGEGGGGGARAIAAHTQCVAASLPRTQLFDAHPPRLLLPVCPHFPNSS